MSDFMRFEIHSGVETLLFIIVYSAWNDAPQGKATAGPRRGEYNVYSTFQSHEPEFDYLKSLEIEEKINKIKWLKRTNPAHFLLSTNGRNVVLLLGLLCSGSFKCTQRCFVVQVHDSFMHILYWSPMCSWSTHIWDNFDFYSLLSL